MHCMQAGNAAEGNAAVSILFHLQSSVVFSNGCVAVIVFTHTVKLKTQLQCGSGVSFTLMFKMYLVCIPCS